MKIDGNRPTHDTEAADATQRSSRDVNVRQGGGVGPAGTSTDRVELSGDAALRAAALKAANAAPDIRPELVDRMREKLEAGKVGHDAGALADAILDSLLK